MCSKEGSLVKHGQHFVSQLANAALFFGPCRERQSWGAEDMALFLERAQGLKEAIEASAGASWTTRADGRR